jgi:hypothetical protein
MTDDSLPPVDQLDLPGPDDPVAWNYVQPGTAVFAGDGERLGTVAAMEGDDQTMVFHGIEVAEDDGTRHEVPADLVETLTPSRIGLSIDRSAFARLGPPAPPPPIIDVDFRDLDDGDASDSGPLRPIDPGRS